MELGVVVATVSLLMTLRAVSPERWMYWWSFSRSWAAIGGGATWLLLAVVSTLGVVAGRHGADLPGPDWAGDVAAALIAQTSLRRLRKPERGGTLALGLLPDVYKWVDHFVGLHVVTWADSLEDDELVAAAARTDDKLKGIKGAATLQRRVEWREATAARLRHPGAVRDESRRDLISLVEAGYSTYFLARKL